MLLLTLTIALEGCTQLGPTLVQAGRNDYNKVLARTEREEQLLNLVRLRYADDPLMLDVSSVSTSFEWTQSLTAQGRAFDAGDADSGFGVDAELGYFEKPTITYTPLGGSDFVRNVMTPVQLGPFLLLANSGWNIERLLRVMTNRMNGLSNARQAAGPTPLEAPDYQDFKRAAELFRVLQLKDLVSSGYAKRGEKRIPLVRFELGAWDTKEAQELANLLGLRQGQKVFSIDTWAKQRRPDELGLSLRSLSGIMFFLSHSVEVPETDLKAGRVAITRYPDGRHFDWSDVVGDLIVVHSSAEPPLTADLSVSYRGNWFYIDERDIQSKYTFMLLTQLTAILAGDIERTAPVLTLPVGG